MGVNIIKLPHIGTRLRNNVIEMREMFLLSRICSTVWFEMTVTLINLLKVERDIMPEIDWEKALQRLNEIEKSISEIAKMTSVNITFYAGVFASLKNRFEKGERTESLFNEIMELH